MQLHGSPWVIFLDAEDDALSLRWRNRGTPIEVRDYLNMQRTTLLTLSRKLSSRFLYIDTGKLKVKEVHKQIMNFIEHDVDD